MAKRSTSPEDRNTLLNMAQLWRELAGDTVVADWIDEVTAKPAAGKHA